MKFQSPKGTKVKRRRRGGLASSVTTAKRSPLKNSPLKSSPAKSPAKSLRHYFKSTVNTNSSSAAATADCLSINPAAKAMRSLDESFNLDLPPASQLDHGVLDALPTQLREKIMDSYNKKGVADKLTPAEVGQSGTNDASEFGDVTEERIAGRSSPVEKTVETENDEVIVRDESRLMEDWKSDIFEWTESFREGPSDDDVIMVATHFCRMASTNLKMVEVCLKIFRRFLMSRELSAWTPCFNVLLEQIQEKVWLVYGGTLKVEPLTGMQHFRSENISRIL